MEVALYHATRRFAFLASAAVVILAALAAWDATHPPVAHRPAPTLKLVVRGAVRHDWASLPVVATRGPQVEIEGWVKRAPLGPFQVRTHGSDAVYAAELCVPSDCERTSIDIGGDDVKNHHWAPDALRHDDASGWWFVSTSDDHLLDAFYEVPSPVTVTAPDAWSRRLEMSAVAASVVLTLLALGLLRGSRHYLRLAYAEVPPPRASRAYRESARLPDRSREIALATRLSAAAVSMLSLAVVAVVVVAVSAAAR